MDLEIEEAWYGYNMWEHVEYRFVPENKYRFVELPDNVTFVREMNRFDGQIPGFYLEISKKKKVFSLISE